MYVDLIKQGTMYSTLFFIFLHVAKMFNL